MQEVCGLVLDGSETVLFILCLLQIYVNQTTWSQAASGLISFKYVFHVNEQEKLRSQYVIICKQPL